MTLKSYWKKLKYWQKTIIVGLGIFAFAFLARYPTNALGWHWLYRAETNVLLALMIIIVYLIVLKIKKVKKK